MNDEQSKYQPPFQWFGGKAGVADIVWAAIGSDVENYVEPFFGSGAVLMLRPSGTWERSRETVNDFDGMVANFWRAVRADPDSVAAWADWPVNENDLTARHLWLVNQKDSLRQRLESNPDYFDAKVAGWWVWGQCCWIGSGWCSGDGPWISDGERLIDRRQLPHVGDDGQGINRKLPHVGNDGRGINRQLPHVGNDGRGINRQRPHVSDDGQGIGQCEAYSAFIRDHVRTLADRLRRVRVCCGDWSRVCTDSVTFQTESKNCICGVFLDPPYADTATRTKGLYAEDCLKVAHRVREWAIANGDRPNMRIVLAGYEGEHEMPASWRVHAYSVGGGMAGTAKTQTKAIANKHRERLWMSPHCIDEREQAKNSLFGMAQIFGETE